MHTVYMWLFAVKIRWTHSHSEMGTADEKTGVDAGSMLQRGVSMLCIKFTYYYFRDNMVLPQPHETIIENQIKNYTNAKHTRQSTQVKANYTLITPINFL